MVQRKKEYEDPYVKIAQKHTPERSPYNWVRYSYELARLIKKECDNKDYFLKRFDEELSKSTQLRTTYDTGFYCISNPQTVLEVYYN